VKHEPDICKPPNKVAARCRERDIIQPSTELRYVTCKGIPDKESEEYI
jgi:hypothetical protein